MDPKHCFKLFKIWLKKKQITRNEIQSAKEETDYQERNTEC